MGEVWSELVVATEEALTADAGTEGVPEVVEG